MVSGWLRGNYYDNGKLMGYYYMINWNVYLVGGIPVASTPFDHV